MELREPDVFVLLHQRDVGDGVGSGIVSLLQDVVRAVGQRIFGGVVHIMHCRVDSADRAVENGLVAVDHPAFVAQEEQSLIANGLQTELIGIRRIGDAQQCRILRFEVILKQIVFSVARSIQEVVFQ